MDIVYADWVSVEQKVPTIVTEMLNVRGMMSLDVGTSVGI
jgi:hypothetical protein